MARKIISLTVLGVVLVVVACAGLAYATPIFTVNTIAVEGTDHLTQDEVAKAAGLNVGDNLLRVHPKDAAAGVAAMPWVKAVTVQRSFPSAVTIELTEREAVAYTDSADGPHLIDADGIEFVIDAPPAEAVALTGGESGSDNWRGAVEILAAVPSQLRSQTGSLDTSDKFNYVFHMKDDRTVTWGANEDNANKARALATVLKMDGKNWNISNPELVSTR